MATLTRTLTHAQLLDCINNSTLNKGEMITISDYVTKHNMQDGTNFMASINTGNEEPLTVLALSQNKIASHAYSTNFPKDKIIYDPTNILCEDGITPRKGKITYREDEFGNSTHYDFRNVKFRRWRFNLSGFTQWISGDTYYTRSLVVYNNELYYCNKTTNGSTLDPSSLYNNFSKFLNNSSYLAWQTDTIALGGGASGGFNIPVDNTSYIDFYTFTDANSNERSEWFRQVKIAEWSSGYNSIIFVETGNNRTRHITCGANNRFMTFGNGNYSINFGTDNYGFIYGNNNKIMEFGIECHSSKFGNNNQLFKWEGKNYQIICLDNIDTMTLGSSNSFIYIRENCNRIIMLSANFNLSIGKSNYDINFGTANNYIELLDANNSYLHFIENNSAIILGQTYNKRNSFQSCGYLYLTDKVVVDNRFCNISNPSSVSAATHISNSYFCNIQRNSSGAYVVIYVNGSNAVVAAPLNS